MLIPQLEQIVGFKNKYTQIRGIEEFVLLFGDREWNEDPFTGEEKTAIDPFIKMDFFLFNNHAFSNSRFVYDHLRDDGCDVKYYEGYACSRDLQFPFFHSWITIGGKILDLTWVDPKDNNIDIRSILYNRKISPHMYIGVEIKGDHIDKYGETCSGSFLEDYGNDFPLLKNYRKNLRLCL